MTWVSVHESVSGRENDLNHAEWHVCIHVCVCVYLYILYSSLGLLPS